MEVLKGINVRQSRKVPDEAPTSFVRKRWEALVRTPDGLDRRFYELCVLSELKNSLRSGDIWVQGSRQFKDFESYLLPSPRFTVQREQKELGLAVEIDCEHFMEARRSCLKSGAAPNMTAQVSARRFRGKQSNLSPTMARNSFFGANDVNS